MKRIIFILLTIIPLCGCSVNQEPPLECISDVYAAAEQPAFCLLTDIPAEAALTASCNDGCCAVFTHPDYEIYHEVFAAESIDEAFVSLTGQTSEQLSPFFVSRFPYEEYRFACTVAGESGPISCSGKLYYDGSYCYALVIRSPISKESEYQETFSDLIAVTTLQAV